MTARIETEKVPLLVIVGPTAVGKSALALQIAQNLTTDLISADSAQVYRFMNIGTAKPTRQEQESVPHHLIDLVNPDQQYSVADYQKDATTAIGDLWRRHKLPVMVGGTGLYIRSITAAYAFGSKGINVEIRDSLSREAELYGLDYLYKKLESVDPKAAVIIHPNDQKRIIRALEVFTAEGRPISEQADLTRTAESPFKTCIFGLEMPRDALYQRIGNRVDQMIKDGFLDEVEELKKMGYRQEDPGMQILGYRQLYYYLSSGGDFKSIIDNIKKETRNLAKRQMTWFRRDKEINWVRVDKSDSLKRITENICKIVKDLVP